MRITLSVVSKNLFNSHRFEGTDVVFRLTRLGKEVSGEFVSAEEEEISRHFSEERWCESSEHSLDTFILYDLFGQLIRRNSFCLLHFVESLELALDELRWAEGERREKGGEKS